MFDFELSRDVTVVDLYSTEREMYSTVFEIAFAKAFIQLLKINLT